jgi:hypothetical protein
MLVHVHYIILVNKQIIYIVFYYHNNDYYLPNLCLHRYPHFPTIHYQYETKYHQTHHCYFSNHNKHTLKTKGTLRNLKKKARRMIKSLQICSKFQKKNKKIRGTFKGSYGVPRLRTFFLKNVFKFRRPKNRFCRKIRNH